MGGALQGVGRKIQQDLDEVGAVNARAHVLEKRLNGQLILTQTWMGAHKMPEIRENLVDAHAS